MNIDELLGIDRSDALQDLAVRQVEQDERLLDALVDRRRELGLTQQQVADRLGVSQSVVARFEGGDRDPHLSTLRRYALAVDSLITHTVESAGGAREAVRLRDQALSSWLWAGRSFRADDQRPVTLPQNAWRSHVWEQQG